MLNLYTPSRDKLAGIRFVREFAQFKEMHINNIHRKIKRKLSGVNFKFYLFKQPQR